MLLWPSLTFACGFLRRWKQRFFRDEVLGQQCDCGPFRILWGFPFWWKYFEKSSLRFGCPALILKFLGCERRPFPLWFRDAGFPRAARACLESHKLLVSAFAFDFQPGESSLFWVTWKTTMQTSLPFQSSKLENILSLLRGSKIACFLNYF